MAMTKVELVEYLSGWNKRLANDASYESKKVSTLLDAYQGIVVNELVLDATLEDLSCNSLECEVG